MTGAPQDANVGTTPVRDGFAFDTARLAGWMAAHVDGFGGPVTVEQFKGGQSNPTYRIATPDRAYVLRRKPPGKLLKGAHAIEREAQVMQGLGKAGFPVPRIFGLCEDERVIGTPFYLMELVEGRIFWDASLPGLAATERAAIYDAMNATIAGLHSIDPAAIGLENYGRPGGYVARQIARWTEQYRQDSDAGRDADMDRVIDWLSDHVPQSDEAAIVHGDFRIDNLIFHPVEPRVVAVLDWELSTLGNPLSDFAYHAMMYRVPPHIVAGLGGIDIAGSGIPGEAAYLAAYCARTGRDVFPDYDVYITFNLFRLAAIFHGIRGRVVRGNASSADAKAKAASLPELTALARASAERARI